MWVNPALAAPPTYGEAPQTNNPPATLNPDNLILSWQEAVKQLEAIKARELELRKAVFALVFPDATEGTNSHQLGQGWQLKAQVNYNYNLDKDAGKVEAVQVQLADKLHLATEAERIFDWKPKLSVREYRLLPPDAKRLVDSVLTISPGTPQLELCPPKGQ
jgi:hypothetical protein